MSSNNLERTDECVQNPVINQHLVMSASTLLAFLALTLQASASVSLQTSQLATVDSTTNSTEMLKQIAQAQNDCRRTSVQVPVGVRREPSFQSPLTGTLTRGTRVAIENRGANGWVPVYAPYKGYVYAGYLTYCGDNPTAATASTPSPAPVPLASLCRQVSAVGGLRVRNTPSTGGTLLGVIANGRNVTIENAGRNGWVPIVAPLKGYVSANYLKFCTQ